MANTGFLQASTDLDYILIAIANKNLVPVNYRKYNNNVFGPGGNLYAWGRNTSGQLGLSSQSTEISIAAVASPTVWNRVVAGFSSRTFGTKIDSTLWAWGSNPHGQLGQNDTTNQSSPVQIGGTNWRLVTQGSYHVHAIKTDGTIWTWGIASNGQLGLNNNSTNYSSPVQIGTETNWSIVEAGGYFSLALKTDGTLWAWGNNSDGQLGQNNNIWRSSPVQIGTGTNWSYINTGIYQGYGIKTDGTLWAWGRNADGQLGLNNKTWMSSPTQVGSGTNWSKIYGSKNGAATIAIKTDGTLWSWGYNFYGSLGLNNTTYYSSPVQVGTNTDWSSLSMGNWHTHLIKTNGTLWFTGRSNDYYQSGITNNTTNYSSPVQVGSSNQWFMVSGGGFDCSLAIAYS